MNTITASNTKELSSWQADTLVVLVTVAAAIGWIFSTNALQEIQPLDFIGKRFLLAGIFLSLFCLPEFKRLSLRQWGAGILTGSVFGIAIIAWIHGLAIANHVGESAFVVSIGVMFMPFFSWLFFKEKLSWTVIAALPIAIGGLALLNLGKQTGISWHWDIAHLVLLGASAIFSFQFCFTAFLAKRIDPLPLTAMQLTVAGIMGTVLSTIFEPSKDPMTTFGWSNIIGAAIIASSLRFFLQTKALKYSPAAHAGMILLLEPIWVTLMGWAFYSQGLTAYQLAGCGLIFSALVFQKVCQLKFSQ